MTDPTTTGAATEGASITRVFDAPRDVVWKAWVEPERFAEWFGGRQADVPVSSVSMDVRPGGAWSATMFFGPERQEIQWSGVFREVSEPERLVLTITDEPGGAKDDDDAVTVVLTDLGDGRTQMAFHQGGGGLTPEGYEGAEKGWNTFFDVMAEQVARH
jgi:uncharacterized protein YndB with AHSA1/START domain